MNDVDLHIHSVYSSDGEFTVQQLVEACGENGIDTFSITDHNSVRGNWEGVEIAQEGNFSYIPGIEIDCTFNGIDLHVLGYHINWKSKDFMTLEEDVSKKVLDSFTAMIDNLGRLGIIVDREEVQGLI